MVRWPLRLVLVAAGVTASLTGGAALLRDNAQVRPLWTGPQAVAIARGELARVETAETTASQAVATLQEQADVMAQEAAFAQQVASAQQATFAQQVASAQEIEGGRAQRRDFREGVGR